MRFYSDNTATAAPEILAAIAAANQGHTVAYGDDPWTQRLDEGLGDAGKRVARSARPFAGIEHDEA